MLSTFYPKSLIEKKTISLTQSVCLFAGASHLKTLFLLGLSIPLFVFLGCEGAPRVRLVKDNDTTFHFQWAEPLKEERIILVRYNSKIVFRPTRDPERRTRPTRDSERRTRQKRDSEWRTRQTPMEVEHLVYFPAGAFVSAPVPSLVWSYPNSWDYIDSVEILPARLRSTVPVPARLYTINHDRFQVHGDQVILRDHPFFQEYHVGKPSRITFPLEPEPRE